MTAYRRPLTLISFLLFGIFLITGSAAAYNVAGGRIFNSNWEEVPLYGVSWFGFETENHIPHGLWTRNWQSMIEQIKGLGFNAIRLPFCPETLRGVTPTSIDYYANPDLAGKDSLEILDLFMAEFSRQGIYVLLDHHRPDCNAISELWYTGSYSEENWIDDLVFLAGRYSDNHHLIGIDIKNEPHGAATWGTGNPATDWNKAAERAAAAILAVNPDILIFVEGIESNPVCSGTVNHWWGGNLEPQNCYPLDIPADRLVFSPHVYGPDVWAQPYFDDPAFPDNLPLIWDTHFGYLADAGKAVIPGEFGGRYGHGGDPDDKIWQDALIDYFIEKDITNFFYWSWNPNSGDTGGILQDDWTTVWEDKVTLLHRLMGDVNPTPTPGPTGEPTVIPQPTLPTIPTPTPGQPGGVALKILYYCQKTTENTQSIRPWFQVENIGSVTIDLTNVAIRYWYTVDGKITQQFYCDWARIGSDNISGEFVSIGDPTSPADYYLEVGFGTGAGSINPGESTGPIQIRFNRSDWTSYDQSDDYSFAPEFTSYGENSRITGYLNNIRVSGTEPGGGEPTPKPNPTVTRTPAPNPSPTPVKTPAPITPEPTSVPVITPTPGSSAGFPDRVFAPYVDVCIYPRFFITDQNQAMGAKYYTLAFVVSDTAGNGIPTWGGYMEYVTSGDWYRDEINGIRALGGDVIVSFGGEAGIELAMAHDNVEDLRGAYQSVIDTYSLTWVDFDIEGAAVADYASIDRRNKAIKLLQDDNPDLKVVFCLPVIPSGLTLDGMNLLRNAIANGVRVDGVNIMAMYFGASAPNPDGRMGEYAIEAANSLFGQLRTLYPAKTDSQLWRMVGVTPVIGRSTATEVFYLEDARKLVAFGLEKNINLLSMWSANRDNGSCGTVSYYSPLCSSLEQEDFAFSMIFDQFTGQSGPPAPTPITTATPVETATPSAIPSPTVPAIPSPTPGEPGTNDLVILYRCQEPAETAQSIRPWFEVVNNTDSIIDLADVTIRYWFTADGDGQQQFWCDWAAIGGENIQGEFISLGSPSSDADYYLEIGFAAGAGELAPGAGTGPIQLRFNRTDWTSYDQSNDYSFAPQLGDYGENLKVTGYLNGLLISGTEPGVSPPPTPGPSSTPAPTVKIPTPTPIPIETPTVTPKPDPTGTPAPEPTATVQTTVPATPKPTATGQPDPTPSPGENPLRVLYRNSAVAPADNQIVPHFNISNTGDAPVALSDLTIRYWFTVDGDRPQNFWCDWARIGANNVTGDFHRLSLPADGADYYLEVGFNAGAGSISAGSSSGEIQCRFAKDNWTDYNENDDYSYNQSQTSFAESERITLYRDGVLIRGDEPPVGDSPAASSRAQPVIANGDYNGDGTSDITLFRPAAGLWAIRGVSRCYFGSSEDIPTSGDYNGDGTAQIAIFRPASGLWSIKDQGTVYFGGENETPVPADYNGDGKDDFAVFRPAAGLWAVSGLTRIYFGTAGDIPLPGDYNGDGTGEIAVFRPSSGLWSIRGKTPVYFGGQADIPAPADYDGDGIIDIALFRPVTGLWAIKDLTRSYFGQQDDTPVPADFDGDGDDDIALFREAAGFWAVRGVTRAYYGSSGDIPIVR